MTSMTKRKYNRRSDEERIREMESRIQELQRKLEVKQRRDSPVLKEIPKLGRRLQKFAQMALDHGRADIANMTTAFTAGLDRIYHTDGPKAVVAAEVEEDLEQPTEE